MASQAYTKLQAWRDMRERPEISDKARANWREGQIGHMQRIGYEQTPAYANERAIQVASRVLQGYIPNAMRYGGKSRKVRRNRKQKRKQTRRV